MATSFGLSHTALGGCAAPGVSRRAQTTCSHTQGVARCNASTSGSSSHLSGSSSYQVFSDHGCTSKYDRIVAFVEAHATPVVSVDASSSFDSSAFVTGEFEQSTWHNSYDEEAEEGELCDEPHLVYAAAAVPHQVAADATAVVSGTWSYGDVENPKPWCYAWDEEAEGGFGLSETLTFSAQRVVERRAALHEARHAARLARKARRSQLHPQLGDLEHMQAWVGPQERKQQQEQRRGKSGLQYQQLLALLASDGASRQYRKPMQWHLTFDEDVHGSEAPETVLGSC